MSVFPSVWRDSGCESHFIVWHGHIDWLVTDTDDGLRPELVESVQKLLRLGMPSSYWDIAEALNEVPWDVLRVCRELVREGIAVEASGQGRGHFSRVG